MLNLMQIEIRSAGEGGIAFTIEGEHRRRCSWADLRSAATQSDAELAAAYNDILARAEAYAWAHSPLLVCYGLDSTNVWYHAWVETAWGEIVVGRTWRGGLTIIASDEGMTLAKGWMAEREAKDIAARIKKIAPTHPVSVVAR